MDTDGEMAMRDPYPEIMTVEQVAAYLQLSKMTVYKFIREGKLPAAKIGKSYRIRRSDVEAFLETAKQAQRGQVSFPLERHAVPVPSSTGSKESPSDLWPAVGTGPPPPYSGWDDPRRERPEIKDLAALTGNPMEWVIKGLN
ncbi:MAG: helix-turn-helix domain-containing protein [Armatimonadota bacterium]|nr:helix-turn-helix domain-containing protein [Armatimonadota bacterium]MDR5702221.1 helix-turn-helix domain-containing protein [Armatimonadota bacterium]